MFLDGGRVFSCRILFFTIFMSYFLSSYVCMPCSLIVFLVFYPFDWFLRLVGFVVLFFLSAFLISGRPILCYVVIFEDVIRCGIIFFFRVVCASIDIVCLPKGDFLDVFCVSFFSLLFCCCVCILIVCVILLCILFILFFIGRVSFLFVLRVVWCRAERARCLVFFPFFIVIGHRSSSCFLFIFPLCGCFGTGARFSIRVSWFPLFRSIVTLYILFMSLSVRCLACLFVSV